MLERRSTTFCIFGTMAKKKLPADTNKRAKSIVDIATGETEDTISKS